MMRKIKYALAFLWGALLAKGVDMNNKAIYARITLEHGGTYIQPLDKLNVLIDEICEVAKEDLSATWQITLIEMTQNQYKALPGFLGH